MMRRAAFHQLALAWAFLAIPTAAMAQGARQTPGGWLAFGVGGGSARTTCPDCLTEWNAATVASVAAGWSFTGRWHVSAEVSGWVNGIGGTHTTYGSADAVVYFQPLASRAFHIRAGGGLSRYVDNISRDGETSKVTTTGFGAQVGVGYDFWQHGSVGIAPFLTYHHAFSADMKSDGESLGVSAHHDVLQLGAALTWRWSSP